MKLKLGLMVHISENISVVRESFKKVIEVGVPTCQVSCTAEEMVGKFDPKEVRKVADELKIEISSFFLLFEGQVFDRHKGPETMGFITEKYRKKRLELAKKFSDIVMKMGVDSITSHVGFIPDDPDSPVYKSFLPVMKEFIKHCKKNKQIFCFETGQELPSTLKRTIEDIDMDNVGINLDPANLILYGMAHPLDAVTILGELVRGMHAKDGLWPDRDDNIGIEVPVGEGSVNFPLLIPLLKKKGFKGPVTIEREITGSQQKTDILKAKKYLENYL